MAKLIGKALVAQGGGPTAVMNQRLAGVVLEARKFSEITKVYGARFGVSGVIKENFLDLSETTSHNLERVADTPGAALGSTRDKPDAEYCHKMFEVMRRHDIRYFYYIGGNDSAETCRIVNDEANKANYELRVIHIPKTIDNDLVGTDHCPGYGSAARYVASAFAGANLDNRSLFGVYIGVVMGRHAGFLTAASALAKKFPDDGPHLIYLPERAFDTEKFCADVVGVYEKFGRCVVAVSEGVEDAAGNLIADGLKKEKETDAHGNVHLSGGGLGDLLADLVKAKIGIKRVRADTLGYLQRSFLGCVSDVDKHEAREVGEKAVQFSVWHNVDGSVAIKRAGDYAVEYCLLPLGDVAGKAKKMPSEFITTVIPAQAGIQDNYSNMVSQEFINYARPLIGDFPVLDRLAAPIVK